MAHRETDSYLAMLYRLAGLFGGLNLAIVASIILGFYVPQHQVVSEPLTLAAMHSQDGITGSFVWGTGSINSQPYYQFMVRQSDDSLTPTRVPADSMVHIIEDASLKGVGYWTSTFTVDVKSPLSAWTMGERRPLLVRQEFRVPAGTVLRNFTAN